MSPPSAFIAGGVPGMLATDCCNVDVGVRTAP